MKEQSIIKFDEVEFAVDGAPAAGYVATLESIRENLKTFMTRRFSVLAEGHDESLSDAPTLLKNYLEVELLIRGIDAPTKVVCHLLNSVLIEWGFKITRDLNHTKAPFAVSGSVRHGVQHNLQFGT
jgi:hypothetical protein